MEHELPADSYSIDLHGIRFWFSTCGAAVVPLTDVTGATNRPRCPDCLMTGGWFVGDR